VARQWVSHNEQQLEEQYRDLFDPETGLAGDLLLRDRLSIGLARARRFNRCVLVVWFQIAPTGDREDTGPAAVRALAGGLQDAVRPDDTVARVGEWEFVVLCNDLAHEDAVERIVRRLHNSIRRALRCSDSEEPLAGIGTALGQPTQIAKLVLMAAHKNVRAIRRETIGAIVA
jgi:GGDEF domain-containing protein